MKKLSKLEFLIQLTFALLVSGLFIYLRAGGNLLREIIISTLLFIMILFALRNYKFSPVCRAFLVCIIGFLFLTFLYSPWINSLIRIDSDSRFLISVVLIWMMLIGWFVIAWRDKSFSFKTKKAMISVALIIALLATLVFAYFSVQILPNILNKYTEEKLNIEASPSISSRATLISVIPSSLIFFIGVFIGIFLMEWLVLKWIHNFGGKKKLKRKLRYKEIKDSSWIKDI